MERDAAASSGDAGEHHAVVGQHLSGNPQVSAALRKQASTSTALNTRRASQPTTRREWSSMMFKISTSLPSARRQWVMSSCHRSLG